MGNLREQIIAELGVAAEIEPKVEVRRRVEFLADYLSSTPATGFVLGISGGQDSSLTGKLCQLAVDELRARDRRRPSSRSGFPTVRRPMPTTRSGHWISSARTMWSRSM
ncbi:NH(3)-dependent NAD(+) synthetase [Nocardia africana]|uniref:NH(3)-dependent NAD(+) synthetase n=1 Tax=Nocardia africana TaxID=134964 RepID=A0A378WQJ5_9NOCA|nr:NH(3)-dependent NAD(+) synthetase [Nocardia africana]